MASPDVLKTNSDRSQQCATLFLHFKDHLPSSSEAAVTSIVTELWGLSRGLLDLKKSVDDPRNDAYLDTIEKERETVSRSITHTLRDLHRHTNLVEELRERGLDDSERARDAYVSSWRKIANYFSDEGDRIRGCETLTARLESYIKLLQDVRAKLEGDSTSRDFKELRNRVDRLLQNQEKSFDELLGMGRLSLGPDVPKFEKQKSWERKRPDEKRPEREHRPRRPARPTEKRRPPPRRKPASESSYDLVDSASDEFDYDDGRQLVDWEYTDDGLSGIPEIVPPRFAEPAGPSGPSGRRPGMSPYSPNRPNPSSMGYFAPAAPEPPNVVGHGYETWSSSAATPSTLGSETESSQMEHWLPEVFSAPKPSTQFRTTGSESGVFGDHEAGVQSHLRDQYDQVIKMPFDDGNVDLRIFIRYDDLRAKILVRQDRGKRSIIACEAVTDLRVLRHESCLQLCQPVKPDRRDRRGGDSRGKVFLWTMLRFPTYERMVLFWCTFHALKAQDEYARIEKLEDATLDGEVCLFSSVIDDDSYRHALHLLRDRDSGGLRLQASALTGELKRCPVWTAFITHQVYSKHWARRVENKKVHLQELTRYVFTDAEQYEPPRGLNGGQQIRFLNSADAKKFIEALQDIAQRKR